MDQLGAGPAHVFAVWDPQSIVSPEFAREALQILEPARAAGQRDRSQPGEQADASLLVHDAAQPVQVRPFGPGTRRRSGSRLGRLWLITRSPSSARAARRVAMRAGWILEMDARFAPVPKNLVFDLMKLERAKTEHCADWRTSSVSRNGRLVRTLFQHPDGLHDGDATYEIALPALPPGKKLLLKFGTVISNRSQDGVRFSVLANGKELWSETQTTFIAPDSSEAKPPGQPAPRQRPLLRPGPGFVGLRGTNAQADAPRQCPRLTTDTIGPTGSSRGLSRHGRVGPALCAHRGSQRTARPTSVGIASPLRSR